MESQPVHGPDTQLRREMLCPATTADHQDEQLVTRKRRRSTSASGDVVFVSETSRGNGCAQRAMLSAEQYVNAARQEAHDAALEDGDVRWHDIGLVSVLGHQEREYEL